MAQGRVTVEFTNAIAWVTIDNQAKRNAMSLVMWEELGRVLTGIGDEVRCLVLLGAGDKAFVAGADISEFEGQRRRPEDVARYDAAADAAMERLYNFPQPTVAMISGFCIGAGMALALCCDMRMADENSSFAIPAARLGVGYGAPNLKHLLDAVGVSIATDLMVSARRLSAQEAFRVGLLNQLHSSDDLRAEVGRYTAAIARNAPLTMRAVKRSIKELARISSSADLALSDQMMKACFASDDYREGIAAFMQKREPQFKGC